MRGLKGKRIVVAGGATGMGAALVRRLVEEGSRVMVGDRNAPALADIAQQIASGGGNILTHEFDMADAASIEALIAAAAAALGGIDGVAIPAGGMVRGDHTLRDTPFDIWERSLRINVIGNAVMMHAALPHLEAAGGGSIVTVSSGAAHLGLETMPAYAASKAGLQALVRHVARIAGKSKVRCNGVSPGLVLSESAKSNVSDEAQQAILDSMPAYRLGVPDDMASIMAFLLSDDGEWVTGQTWSVSGGISMRD